MSTPVRKYAAVLRPPRYVGAIIAALLGALAIGGWAKLTTFPTHAVGAEDRFPAGVNLGGGLYEQPLLF